MAIKSGSQTARPFVDSNVMFPRRQVYVSQNNCDQYIFGDFIDSILRSIEDDPASGDVDDECCILWDNINLHKKAYVTHLIYDCPTNNRFVSVDYPPYRPVMATIKYIFCELASELSRKVQEGWKMEDLRLNVLQIYSTIGRNRKFENTLAHCNYPYI